MQMNRPRLNDSLAPDNVLSRMVPGKTYGAYALAAKFHVRTAKMRPVLEKMISGGMLELSTSQPGTVGFRRAKETAQPIEQEPVLTTVATPPVLVRLDGTLTGYDNEIARRVALCMLVRTK
jgi:hypothetical protein